MFKLGAAIMVRNMAPFLRACLNSIEWMDGVYIYDDGSTDETAQILSSFSGTRLVVEKSVHEEPAFSRGELEARNYVINRAFESLGVDYLAILDGDELLSSDIRKVVEVEMFGNKADSICFTTWHLFDETRYLHFWETSMNGVRMVDPHTRIISKGKKFEPLIEGGSHPIINPTKLTFCTNGPYHFHLKYYSKSKYPNFALNFLPKNPSLDDLKPYLRNLVFKLPIKVINLLQMVEWGKMKADASDYYNAYNEERFLASKPQENLIHPKDK